MSHSGQSPWGPPPQAPQWGPGWPPATPQPRPGRGPTPFILAGLSVLALVMLGLVLYALLSGPNYQHDDYVPPVAGELPPLPAFNPGEAETLTSANPIYAQSVATPVRCDVVPPGPDATQVTDAEFGAYLDAMIACNLRVFDPTVRETQRFALIRPIVNVYHESVSTPCGTLEPNGAVCYPNEQVYFSRSAGWDTWPVIDEVLAHEFGHALQYRTLIVSSRNALVEAAGSRDEALELNRRLESQADCLSGIFVQAVNQSRAYTEADHQEMLQDVDNAGNRRNAPSTHGRPETRIYWYTLGLNSAELASCNTFTAPSDYVR